jgi:hypothetical protein
MKTRLFLRRLAGDGQVKRRGNLPPSGYHRRAQAEQ